MSYINDSIRDDLQASIARPLAAQSLLVTALIEGVAVFGISQAHADLVIHNEPSQKMKVTKIMRISSNEIKPQAYNIQSTNMQKSSDTSIIKLMQVMHIDEQITAIVNGQQAAIDAINNQAQNRTQQSGDDELNERQRELQAQIQAILGRYAKIMANSIGDTTDIEKMTQAYINAAKTYYTQAEVEAQIKFYDTNIGQSILAKQSQVTAAFLKQSLPDDMSDTTNQLGELLPQMEQIIKDVL